ncbi:hypothetical protein ANANG_G00097710 [Anguilla anguilla]|uniref:Ring finger protein 24 n=1 Tax=Anguilla anguilla TaxID=7936 RepID=A0A9D3MJC9_ANGAN|nr:hypothetical protein ANANG_G00097710 [Anguilla anguilla]
MLKDLISMSSDFQHYSFRMPNIGFQNLPLNIYIVVFGTAIFVFILSLLFCCYLIRLRHQAHKELYAYKQVIQKEKVKELNLHEAGMLEGVSCLTAQIKIEPRRVLASFAARPQRLTLLLSFGGLPNLARAFGALSASPLMKSPRGGPGPST